MAMVETTFTVQVQTWVNPGETQVRIDALRTWRELYRQIANAGIGWTLEVTTDTLNGKNGGTFAGKMQHTATGLWYNCFTTTDTSASYSYDYSPMYTATGKHVGRVRATSPLYYNATANGQNTYFVDNINGGVFQDCRGAQGNSSCLWRIARGELIDGTSEGYAAQLSLDGTSDSAHSIIIDLYGFSDLVGSAQSIAFQSVAGRTGSASQLYVGRCYGIREGQTAGVTVTWGGKKIYRTVYTLMPKATYSINGTRYTALDRNTLLEE